MFNYSKYRGNQAALTASPSTSGNGTLVALPSGTNAFMVTVRTATVYMTLDGTAPSATNGLELPAGSAPMFFPSGDSPTFLASTGAPVVNVQPFK